MLPKRKSGFGGVGRSNPSAKLDEDDVRTLRRLRDVEGYSFAELGRKFGIHPQAARRAYHRHTWAHVDD